MGSFTVSSIFTCGYRRLGIPLTLCRALASADGYSLSKHNHINELGLCALVPSRRNFGCKSLKLDAEYTNAVNGYFKFHSFKAYLLWLSNNFCFFFQPGCLCFDEMFSLCLMT
uniref:RNA pseudouridine synthase 6ic n=1 Tax=Rhizophora mucronata TaxID=61149 RepID=A0A2P2KV58_RHIMU